MTGTAGGQVLTGSAGAETLSPGPGNNYIFGDGSTTVSYANSPTGILVDLVHGAANNGYGGTDKLTNIHSLIGSTHDDTVTSGSGFILAGGPGADHFVFASTALADGLAGIFDEITDYNQGNNGSYNSAEGDQIDLSALLSSAYNHGSGQAVPSLVRALEDPSHTFTTLQIDPDGAVNGVNWVTIARLDGIHAGNNLSIILDASLPTGTTISVTGGTIIESKGAVTLAQVGTSFFLDGSGGTGPSLKLNGADVVAGQLGGWAPIGAEPSAGGYEVAWKMAGADQYTVWQTNSSGNYVSNIIGVVAGASTALVSLEASFSQDLNLDGTIGAPAQAGASSLSQNSLNGTTTQSVVVTVGGQGNDTFIFKPGFGEYVIANATSADTFELDGFSSVTDIHQLQVLLNDAQSGQLQSLFQMANGHDTVINLGNHDSVTLTNINITDLHASNFIIH